MPEIMTDAYRVWTEGSTLHFSGKMRLLGPDAYTPIREMMDAFLVAEEGEVTLNLTRLNFLNSSGINLLAKFTIEVRKLGRSGMVVHGSKTIPWQAKSLPNLKRLYPAMDLLID